MRPVSFARIDHHFCTMLWTAMTGTQPPNESGSEARVPQCMPGSTKLGPLAEYAARTCVHASSHARLDEASLLCKQIVCANCSHHSEALVTTFGNVSEMQLLLCASNEYCAYYRSLSTTWKQRVRQVSALPHLHSVDACLPLLSQLRWQGLQALPHTFAAADATQSELCSSNHTVGARAHARWKLICCRCECKDYLGSMAAE